MYAALHRSGPECGRRYVHWRARRFPESTSFARVGDRGGDFVMVNARARTHRNRAYNRTCALHAIVAPKPAEGVRLFAMRQGERYDKSISVWNFERFIAKWDRKFRVLGSCVGRRRDRSSCPRPAPPGETLGRKSINDGLSDILHPFFVRDSAPRLSGADELCAYRDVLCLAHKKH
jgi:hypothetical protein